MPNTIYHRKKSDEPDDDSLRDGIVKPQRYWNQDQHLLRGSLALMEWAPAYTPVDNDWRSLAYSPPLNRMVAVSSNGSGNQVMTSGTGGDWVAGVTPLPVRGWVKVIWVDDLELFVAVGENGVMTSPDGDTWTHQTPASNAGWHDVVWADSLGLLVAVAWSGHPNQVMTSPDAITWTLRTTPMNAQWECVEWSSPLGMLVAGADSGTAINRIMRSTDGINWELCTIPNIANAAYYQITWVGIFSCFIALNSATGASAALLSSNGIAWTSMAGGFGTAWKCMAYSPFLEVVIALSEAGRVMMAEEPNRWVMVGYAETVSWGSVIWVDFYKRFVAVARTGFGSRAGYCQIQVEELPEAP